MSQQLYICEFCNKSYSSVSSLNYHKKNTKSCILLQNKVNQPQYSYTLEPRINKTAELENQVKFLTEQLSIYKKEAEMWKQESTILNQQMELLLYQNNKPSTPSNININNTNCNNTNCNNTNVVNNTQNNYKTQFNALFNNLVVFNCNNVVDSIKDLKTSQHISTLDLNDIQQSLIEDLVINSINKFTFCTDERRKVMIIKNPSGSQTRTKLDDFLADYIHYGKDEIHNYLDTTHDHINNVIDNDALEDEAIWYNFKRTKDELQEKIKQVYKATDIKETDLAKQIYTQVETDGHTLKKT